MRKLILSCFVLCLHIGCKEQLKETKPKQIEESFSIFLKKFETKSIVQLSRIVFPLKNVLKEEERDSIHIIEKDEWKFTDLTKIDGIVIEKEVLSKDKIDVIYMIEDTGVHVTYHFVNRKGLWWLIGITDESD
jgi:hypothetical protein